MKQTRPSAACMCARARASGGRAAGARLPCLVSDSQLWRLQQQPPLRLTPPRFGFWSAVDRNPAPEVASEPNPRRQGCDDRSNPRFPGEKTRRASDMNPLCSRCNQVVYPTEKVNCLDKVRARNILIFFLYSFSYTNGFLFSC